MNEGAPYLAVFARCGVFRFKRRVPRVSLPLRDLGQILRLISVSLKSDRNNSQPSPTLFSHPLCDIWAGCPPVIFVRTIPTVGASSLRFLQGWAAMLSVLFDLLGHAAKAVPRRAFGPVRNDRG